MSGTKRQPLNDTPVGRDLVLAGCTEWVIINGIMRPENDGKDVAGWVYQTMHYPDGTDRRIPIYRK